ncbi:hypothetical protein QYE76_016984, partial [Lolium multiflorum]
MGFAAAASLEGFPYRGSRYWGFATEALSRRKGNAGCHARAPHHRYVLDPNDQVDQVIPPRPRRTKEEIEARRLARRERNLEIREHTHDKVLGDIRAKVSTRRQLANFSNHHAYISLVEPKKVFEALEDSDWLEAMHEELNNFKRNKVWTLVEKPKECRNVIGTKWIFKNKQDEFGNVVRNKARLVAQ